VRHVDAAFTEIRQDAIDGGLGARAARHEFPELAQLHHEPVQVATQ
jgi:hypothetical protein